MVVDPHTPVEMSDWANLLEETDVTIAKEVDKINLSAVDSNKTAVPAAPPDPAAPPVPAVPAVPESRPAEEPAEDPGLSNCLCVRLFVC